MFLGLCPRDALIGVPEGGRRRLPRELGLGSRGSCGTLGPTLTVTPPAADALHAHGSLFLGCSSQDSPLLPDAPASSPPVLRAQRPGRRVSQDSSHSESSGSSDSLAPVGASHSE